MPLLLRSLSMALVIALACSAPVSAQAPGAPTAPEGRGYTVGWLLVAGLSGAALAAACRSAYRHTKEGDA